MTLRDALILGRVSNLPTVWTNVLAGVVLVGAAPSPATLAVLITAMSLFYVAGMYLNDAFDREIDKRQRPTRPIPSGRVSVLTVFAAGFGMLLVAIILLAVAGASTDAGPWRPMIGGIVLAGLIVRYDSNHKESALSPLVMGLCRVSVYVCAALATASALDPSVDGPSLLAGSAVLLCYLIGLTYAAKQETLRRITNAWPLLFLAAPFVFGLFVAFDDPRVFIVLLPAGLWVLNALTYLFADKPNIPNAIVRFIAGISLVDALLIAGHGAWLMAAFAAAGCALTRVLQDHVPGT
jgi:hypothetical protein